jgi:tight adherence protein B
MSRAVLAAGLAGALAVAAAWEALAAAEAGGGLARLGPLAGRLVRVGRDGREAAPRDRRRLGVLAAAVLFGGGWLLAGPVVGVGLAAVGPAAAVRVVAARRRRWRAALAREAPLAARALADALGAGHGVRGAMGEAARGLAGASGPELRSAAAALAAGERTEAAIERLRARAGGEEWDAIAAAMLLQRDAGGDLAHLLRVLAAAQEEAARLVTDARGATTQARFTGFIVCALPLGAGVLLQVAAPAAVSAIVATPVGVLLAVLAVVLQVGSLVAIRRLGRVPG